MKGEKQIKKFSYTFYSWSALIDRFLNLYKAFTPPWTSMEFRTFIMLNTDIRKSFKKLGVQVLIGLYLLFLCDFIIAHIFPFFNWHFSRSFQNIFVEQGELSATFRKCIYKKHFLWYNGNVGACENFLVFRLWAPGEKSPPFFFLYEKKALVWAKRGSPAPNVGKAAARKKSGQRPPKARTWK